LFPSPKLSVPYLEPSQPPIQGVPSLLVVRRPGCEADHSPPSNTEIENEWSCTSTPPVCLHGVDRDSFTFFDNVDHMGYIIMVESSNTVELHYNITEGTE
jgi:hypothetical protein